MNDLEKQERLLDLLTEQAVFGLDEHNQKELNDLIKLFPEWQNDESLSLTATALALSAVVQRGNARAFKNENFGGIRPIFRQSGKRT
jgi:hypothetical protein